MMAFIPPADWEHSVMGWLLAPDSPEWRNDLYEGLRFTNVFQGWRKVAIAGMPYTPAA